MPEPLRRGSPSPTNPDDTSWIRSFIKDATKDGPRREQGGQSTVLVVTGSNSLVVGRDYLPTYVRRPPQHPEGA